MFSVIVPCSPVSSTSLSTYHPQVASAHLQTHAAPPQALPRRGPKKRAEGAPHLVQDLPQRERSTRVKPGPRHNLQPERVRFCLEFPRVRLLRHSAVEERERRRERVPDDGERDRECPRGAAQDVKDDAGEREESCEAAKLVGTGKEVGRRRTRAPRSRAARRRARSRARGRQRASSRRHHRLTAGPCRPSGLSC